MSDEDEAAVEGAEEEVAEAPEAPAEQPKRRGRPPKPKGTQVVCIVTTKPWTGQKDADGNDEILEHGAKTYVPDDIAKLMEEKGLVTVV